MRQRFAWILLALLLWLAQLHLPLAPGTPSLDESWQQALSRALVEGVRFGRGLVFTYGPLGGFVFPRYEPTLFWPQILLFECLFKGLLVWRWIVALQRTSSPVDRIAYVLALFAFTLAEDAFYMTTLAVLGASLLRPEPGNARERALELLLVVAIGYVKFTFFCFAAVIALLLVLRGPRLRMLVLWSVCQVGVWMLCGQRPSDLPLYVLRSAQLAGGYTEAQALDGPAFDIGWACASFAVFALLLALYGREARWTALALLVGAALAFRASFVCQVGPAVVFFAYAMLAPCALGPAPRRRVAIGALRALGWALALAGYVQLWNDGSFRPALRQGLGRIATSAYSLAHLPTLRAELEQRGRALAEQYDLPRVRACVGENGIDLIGSDLGWLFLNRLHWRPRPVLQSYSTSTAGLVALDGEFFEGADAPPYVLYQDSVILERLSWMDDSQARFALLRSYVPVVFEKGLLLLRRDPERAARPVPARVTLEHYELRPNEPLQLEALPGTLLVARFDVRYNWRGQLRRLWLRAPETRIEITRDDGFVYERRLMPDMARAGVLVRPLLEFTEDLLGLYVGQPTRRYATLRVFSAGEWSAGYEPTWGVTIERCDALLPLPQPEQGEALMLGSFAPRPSRVQGSAPPRATWSDGRELVYVAPDAEFAFELPERARHLTGLCGQPEAALRQGDGIEFEVELQSAGGATRRLWSRTLDRTRPDSRRVPIDLEFPPARGQTLVLRFRNPPGHDARADQPFLSGIAIGE